MPTYEYVCSKCGQQFEKVQSIKDKPLAVCPKDLCKLKKWGKGKVKKLIGAGAGLIFKGSGFYITDYRSENYKAAAKKESGGGETKSSGSSGGGENKSSSATSGSESKASPAKSESKPKKD